MLAAGMIACSGKHDSQESTVTATASGNSAVFNSEAHGEERQPGFGDGFGATEEILWDTPDLPTGIELEIAGVKVDRHVLEGFLLPEWSSYASSLPLETPVDELTANFFANPEELFYPLVRGVVLLREAEVRFPELDADELAHYKQRMEGAVGTVKDSLIKRYGVDGWNAHVERKFRLMLILNEYQQYAAEVTDDDLYTFYDSEILANLPEPEKREQIDISFKSMEPMLRAKLMKDRAIDAQEEWLDGVIIGVEVAATLPVDLSHSWTITELP